MKAHKRLLLIVVAVLTAVTLIAATGTQPAVAAKEVKDCNKWHTVQKGEYLKSIAKQYGVTWQVLVEINGLKNPNKIFPGQKLCVSTTSKPAPTQIPIPVSGSLSGNIYASSAKEDLTVTLVGKSLIPYSTYTLYLSNFKAKNPVYYLAGTATADKAGAFSATCNIPKKLYDVVKIKVIATNNRGSSATNWFFNATYDGNTGGIGAPTLNFVIESVKKDGTVKIKTSNLPILSKEVP